MSGSGDASSAEIERELVALVRHRAGAGEAPVLGAGEGANRLWTRAGEEGLRGLLVEQLARQGLAGGRGRRAQLDDFAHGARLLGLLGRLGRELERRGSRVIVLKGAAMVGDLYGGRLGQRPMSDLDILPRPGDLELLREVLGGLGLRPAPTCWRGAGVEVDVHEDLVGSEFLGRRRLAFRFDADRLWSASVPMGPGLARLCDCHLALHLAVHALKHAYRRWIWLLDMALLFPRLDGDELVREARRTGAGRALAYACRAIEKAFGLEAPAWSAELPALGHLERSYIDAVVARPQPFQLGGAVTALSIERWPSRVAYLLELTWPRDRMLHAAHGAGSSLARRCRRTLGRALPGAGQLLALALSGRREGR